MTSEIRAQQHYLDGAGMTIRDPSSVHKWLLCSAHELGALSAKVNSLRFKLSKEPDKMNYSLLQHVSTVLQGYVYIKEKQLVIDHYLLGLPEYQPTERGSMLVETRAYIAQMFEPPFNQLMHLCEKTQIVPRMLEGLKEKTRALEEAQPIMESMPTLKGRVKKQPSKPLSKQQRRALSKIENYRSLPELYAHCLRLQAQIGEVQVELAPRHLFSQLLLDLKLVEETPVLLPHVPTSSSSQQQSISVESEISNCSSEPEGELNFSPEHRAMILSFMNQPRENRIAQFMALSTEQQEQICSIVAEGFDKWTPVEHDEEELDLAWARQFLVSELKGEK